MKDLGAPSGRDAPTIPLLPCPFCGSDVISTEADGAQGLKWGYAYCGSCGVRGPEVRTSYDPSPNAQWRKTAFTEWNRRSVPERGGDGEVPDVFHHAQWLLTMEEATPPKDRTPMQTRTIAVCSAYIALVRPKAGRSR